MKKSMINILISAVFIAGLGFAATSAVAGPGPDFLQQKLIMQVLQAKQKLQQAQAAKGAEQQKLMAEHMQMLHDDMAACREMKPKAGMTESEPDEWFAEHQKIMDNMMSQMMEEHKVGMAAAPCDTVKK